MHQFRLFRLCVAFLLLIASTAFADPPARVGRISYIAGDASFRTDRDDSWEPAALNFPITTGNEITTDDNARLEIRVGSSAIRLDENSAIFVSRLDDDTVRINLREGVVNITVRSPESSTPIEVMTQAGKVILNNSGTYRLVSDRDDQDLSITTFRGSATLDTGDNEVTIREGRELVIEDLDPLEYSRRNAKRSSFDDWAATRDTRIDRSRSTRYMSPEIAGHEDLDEYGDWQDTREYGAVWIPRNTVAEWAPYRYGRWAWVDPWGWTWIDYAPWGFAPFHYGRWVYFSGRWGWTPGVVARRPVYAPALVAFIGGSGWNVSFAFGTAPAVGWVPLGYHDIYRPGYKASPTYVRNINITNIDVRHVNITNINWKNPPAPNYSLRKNPHAVTIVPTQAFTSGKPLINQAAKISAPIAEPVVGSVPHIAAPVRRGEQDRRNRRRETANPPSSADKPAPEVQRRVTPNMEQRPQEGRRGEDREREQSHGRRNIESAPAAPETRLPQPSRQTREIKAPSPDNDRQNHDRDRQRRHNDRDATQAPQQAIDTNARPPQTAPAQIQREIRQEPRGDERGRRERSVNPAPPQEAPDNNRRQWHQSPPQTQREIRPENRADEHGRPERRERSNQAPGQDNERHGNGRRHGD